jgi:multidrug efflux pump subunit AcrA (membrane-fusion protein)
MRTSILSVTIFCLSAGFLAKADDSWNNNMGWGGQMTRQQIYAQKREAARQARAQRAAEAQQRRATQIAEMQQRQAERQQQLQLARQQRAEARAAKIAARNGGYSNSYAMTNYGGSSRLAGHQCSNSDSDENTCLACAVYGENRGPDSGMRFVVGNIRTRLASGRYGNSICDVVHGVMSKYPRGQYVGAHHYIVDDGKGTLNRIENNLSAPANGVMGFHSCRIRGVATNCPTADAGPAIIPDPYMTAAEIEEQAAERQYYEMAYLPDDQGAG